jgi:hypothetical protein
MGADMSTKHKHAEVIKAWADGAEIEIKGDSVWYSIKPPTFLEHCEYRIKPETKPDCFRYIGVCFANGSTTNLRQVEPCNVAWDCAIKITFDGETNKPKSVELI